ncbi:MAG: acylneuraminate cytidylyltransferase family protein [Thermincola sp.]|nr:acylneuraminate cytidylyltransferase family protein [Thermincola sp.]MDT3703475.1 acylneuraminate cytidylyltransferase family protein [Thermincola sp.]
MQRGYLALIPARGGSKGVKRKNIVEVAGRPLIQYTIEPALRALQKGLVDRVVVSTDCPEIAAVAEGLGAEVPFLRPAELASDTAKTVDVVLHAVNFFEEQNIFFKAALLLQPTNPLRSYEDIHNAIGMFKSGNSPTLISGHRDVHLNDLVLYRKRDNIGVPLHEGHNKGIRRQEVEGLYIRNGAIYITEVEYLKANRQIISDLPILYEIEKDKAVNIDTEEDLAQLRWILCK